MLVRALCMVILGSVLFHTGQACHKKLVALDDWTLNILNGMTININSDTNNYIYKPEIKSSDDCKEDCMKDQDCKVGSFVDGHCYQGDENTDLEEASPSEEVFQKVHNSGANFYPALSLVIASAGLSVFLNW